MNDAHDTEELADRGAPALLAERAYRRLVDLMRANRIRSGQFVSLSALMELMDFPLAATREAVKRAEVHGLVSVLPKRGVQVMDAGPETTRICMDLRMMLDQEGARRLIASDRVPDLAPLRRAHEDLRDAARAAMRPDLPGRALTTDRSLHDLLSEGLDNPLARAAYAVNRDRIAIIQNTRLFLPDRIVPAMEEHLAIMDALEARDAAATADALAEHHCNTLRWWGIFI